MLCFFCVLNRRIQSVFAVEGYESTMNGSIWWYILYIEEAENIVAKKTSCKIFFNQKTVAVHVRKTKFMQMHLYLNLIWIKMKWMNSKSFPIKIKNRCSLILWQTGGPQRNLPQLDCFALSSPSMASAAEAKVRTEAAGSLREFWVPESLLYLHEDVVVRVSNLPLKPAMLILDIAYILSCHRLISCPEKFANSLCVNFLLICIALMFTSGNCSGYSWTCVYLSSTTH